MKKIILSIDGMTCSACSNGLEKYLNKQDGIESATVNLVMANATVKYDEKKLNIEQIEVFVKKAGFKSLGEFKEEDLNKKSKNKKIIFIIYTILAILLMYISMGHMLSLPSIPLFDINKNPLNYMLILLIITILFLIYGFDILKNGYKNLIHKTPNMDTLVSLGVLTSFIFSIYNLIKGNETNLYFDSSSIVIYFVKLGRYIDTISKDKTKETISKLVTITPQNATIKKDNELITTTINEIKKGDIVVCKPGEKIAVDGIIVSGSSHLDEAFITGESKPKQKEKNDYVLAGSLNYDGYLEYKADKIGSSSTVSEIVRLVSEASSSKVPLARIADKVSEYFVPTVLLFALLTLILQLIITKNINEALISFVTVLVVACPCSLGLATPLAIVVSEGLCVEKGILIKKSEVLENAKKIDTIIFDKTGTLTYGKLKISKIYNYSTLDNKQLMQIVSSIENKSIHPIATSFIDYTSKNNINLLEVKDFENISGLGLTATINNEKIYIGNNKILTKYRIKNNHLEDEEKLSESGNSVVYVANKKEVLAIIGVNDILRKESKSLIKELNKNNIETIMLTGDNELTANIIAKELGIKNVIANVLPKEKTKVIKDLKKENKNIIMCGDGINDSPSLALADIGISISDGTDIASSSSDVILTNNNLNCILDLINISKKTVRIIKQNLFWAFFYNILMLPIAAGLFKTFGISINPMIASLAMILSSITVILNALRLKK